MRVIVIGATGTIGKAVVEALSGRHEVIRVGRRSGDYQVDATSRESIERLFRDIGPFDALISLVGGAAFKPLAELTDEDFLSLRASGPAHEIQVARHDRRFRPVPHVAAIARGRVRRAVEDALGAVRCLRGRRRDRTADRAARGRRCGGAPSVVASGPMQPTYAADAETYREKVQAFLDARRQQKRNEQLRYRC